MQSHVYCIGINHRTASIEVREKLWFSPEETRTVLTMLKGSAVDECVLLSTCNRTELYFLAKDAEHSGDRLWKALLRFKSLDPDREAGPVYVLRSLFAIDHLFKVASGIDSMVLGDVQIVNQVKAAFALAQESASVGPILHRCFTQALHVSKRVRSETEIAEGAVSVGYAAAELVAKIFGNLSGRSAIVIGAGETGELTATHLQSRHLGKLFISNRTFKHAEDVARRIGGTAINFGSYRELLREVDIVISCVAGETATLGREDIVGAMKLRNRNPLVVIDLGVPRNVDPAAVGVENLFLHDVDDLQHIVKRNLQRRAQELPKTRQILLEELTELKQWIDARELAPTLEELQRRFEEIRSGEVERVHHRFDPRVYDEITLITKRIVGKILHAPMVHLRSGTHRGTAGEQIADVKLLRSLFGLGHSLRDNPVPPPC